MGGQVCDALVSHIDLYPTLCDLAGAPYPSWLQGSSLLPLVEGRSRTVHDAVFAEVTYHAAYEPQRGVRTARYSYIRRFGDRTLPVLPNCDDGLSKDLLLDGGWATRPMAAEQLYDLLFDPNESCNLCGDDMYREVLDEMRDRLQTWMQSTGDPLLRGDVATPAGAKVNNPAGLSPREPVETVNH